MYCLLVSIILSAVMGVKQACETTIGFTPFLDNYLEGINVLSVLNAALKSSCATTSLLM